ncbi:MAG: hypothetical protein HQK50_05070 [Oligoflexia bacterium]|nr:hypothetical protein [Oligoflexia bacterium]MBF0364919.1 hypothetical protein [Oligoflexia bacterium]
MQTHLLFLLLIFSLSPTLTSASIILEPFASMSTSGTATSQINTSTSTSSTSISVATFDLTSKNYGARLAYLLENALFGYEYARGSVRLTLTNPKFTSERYSGSYQATYNAVYLGYYSRINLLMPWMSYYLKVRYDYGGSRGSDSGKGYALALSYIGSRYLTIYGQYRKFTLTSKGLNDSRTDVGDNKITTKEYLVGVTLPLWLDL